MTLFILLSRAGQRVLVFLGVCSGKLIHVLLGGSGVRDLQILPGLILRGILRIFSRGIYPAILGGIFWISRGPVLSVNEISLPHKRVPRKFLYPIPDPVEKGTSHSRTIVSPGYFRQDLSRIP